MRESDKERTKLSATFLNNLGLAIIVAGFVAPLAAYGFRSSSLPSGDQAAVLLSLIGFQSALSYISWQGPS